MTNTIEMVIKNSSIKVNVYTFDLEKNIALVWNPSIAKKQSGNGWQKTNIKNLIPVDIYEEYFLNEEFVSKTEKNKIKSLLTLTKAEWTCTDGTSFNNCDEAIKYQRELIRKENE